MDIKQELISIHQELDALSKQAAYDVDLVGRGITDPNDKNQIILARVNDAIDMAEKLKAFLLGYGSSQIAESDTKLTKVESFVTDIKALADALNKDVGEAKTQKGLRFVAPARDAKEKQKDPLAAAFNAAKNVVRKVIQQT